MSAKAEKYITIDDFSPGIYSAGTWQIDGANVAGRMVAGAPLGSAQETNTYRVIPTPNGRGLMPAPRGTALTFSRAILSGTPANVTHAVVTGLTAFPGNVEPGIFIIGFWTFEPAGVGTRGYILSSTNGAPLTLSTVMQAAVNAAGTDNTTTRSSTGFVKLAMSMVSPYFNALDTIYRIFYSASDPISQVRYMPPDAPGVAVGTTNIYASFLFGRIFAHQARLVTLVSSAPDPLFNATIQGNQAFSRLLYNDPANSNVFPTTNYYQFETEDPVGYGAVGSLNASTLLCVRVSSGGVVVQGDLNNPIVTRVPGITGTNMMSTDACVSPIGIVYASGNNGMHVWQGGATSQKISNQLRDDFYQPSGISVTKWLGLNNANGTNFGTGGGWGVSTRYWGNFIVTSNNFMYHLPTNGWWRIDDPSTFSSIYWDNTYWPGYLVGAVDTEFTSLSATITWGRYYDNQLGATNWSWQSQAIPLTVEKMIGVDEFIITCQGAGTIQISGRSYTGNTAGSDDSLTAPVTVTLPAEAANQPVKIRVPFSIMGYNIIFRMVADNGSNTAPTVHRVDIGYDDTNLVAVQ